MQNDSFYLARNNTLYCSVYYCLLDSIGLFEKTLKRATDWFFLVLGLIAGLCILSSIGEQLHISIYVEDVGSIPAGYIAVQPR